MNKNNLKKEFTKGEVQLDNGSKPTKQELKLINNYARRQLTSEEVYVFSLVLCDNDIDRDNERFTVESLFKLEKLFVGKTGIFDHNPTAKNQTARIISCKVESVANVKTKTNDDYFRLIARAYIPNCEGNKDFIVAIDSGIVKEVSISCSVENMVCSICGESLRDCPHEKGNVYDNKICCGELTNPYDAYEWSFVAIPSQIKAGVIKSYNKEGNNSMEEILKSLNAKQNIMLSKEQCTKLCGYIDKLKQSATDGVLYRESLTSKVIKLSLVVQPEISKKTMEQLTKNMTVLQLNEFINAFETKKSKILPSAVQLYNKEENTTDNYSQFAI